MKKYLGKIIPIQTDELGFKHRKIVSVSTDWIFNNPQNLQPHLDGFWPSILRKSMIQRQLQPTLKSVRLSDQTIVILQFWRAITRLRRVCVILAYSYCTHREKSNDIKILNFDGEGGTDLSAADRGLRRLCMWLLQQKNFYFPRFLGFSLEFDYDIRF